MRSPRMKFKVAQFVIGLVFIFVVNNFSAYQRSPKLLAHTYDMLSDPDAAKFNAVAANALNDVAVNRVKVSVSEISFLCHAAYTVA